MNNPSQRSVAVTASGVIAILGSTMTAIGVLVSTVGILFMPMARPGREVPGMRAIELLMMAIFFAIAVWGIGTGVGLLRFRNWARISVLVWSGIAAPMALLIIVVFLFVPLPTLTGSQATTGMFVRGSLILFYAAPLAIAIWWLVLFTRARVVAQFKTAPVGARASFPIEGDPALGENATMWSPGSSGPAAYAVPPPMPAPALPIPIVVLACFFLLTGVSLVMVFILRMPAVILGAAIGGAGGMAVYVAWCLLYLVSGVGILRRRGWSYSVAIGLQVFGVVNGVITALNPNLDATMQRVLGNANLPAFQYSGVPVMAHMRAYTVMTLIFPLAILGILVYYRPRFLEAARKKA